MKEIKRDKYLNQLLKRQGNGLVKVVTGIRRCGKSYLVFNIFKEYLLKNGVSEDHIFEMSFDGFENIKYRDPEIFYPYVKSMINNDKPFYILLDEIQYLENFESVLNGLIRLKNVDIYVTGSNAKLLSKDIITEFRGRSDKIEMHPLSFSEFMSVYDGSKIDGLDEYMTYGGMPLVLDYETHKDKYNFLADLFKETYIQDIINRYNIRKTSDLETVIDIICSTIGCLTNVDKITSTFKSAHNKEISTNTVKKYIEYLEDSFLIKKVQRYDVKSRKYISTPQKYYFTDTGLRNARLEFRQTEPTHLLENAIYNELSMQGFNVDVGVVNQYQNGEGQQSRKQLEIDFVCNKGSKRFYIQSAYAMPSQDKVKQEQKSLTLTGDFFKKVIISPDIIGTHYNDDGILLVNVFDFFLKPESLDY